MPFYSPHYDFEKDLQAAVEEPESRKGVLLRVLCGLMCACSLFVAFVILRQGDVL